MTDFTDALLGDTTGLVIPATNDSNTEGGVNASILKQALELDEVDNTADADKPISTATQTALDAKEDDGVAAAAVATHESTYDHTQLHEHANKAVLDATTASFTTADEDKLDAIEAGATADQSAAEILAAVESESGRDMSVDGSKLDAIEAGATADQTGAEIQTLLEAEIGGALGTAAQADSGDFATTAQGVKADSAVQEDETSDFSAFQGVAESSLTDGATIDWDLATSQNATVTITDNRTMNAPTNLATGYATLAVTQDGTGSRTITWDAAFNFGAAGEPTLTTTASAKDLLQFYCDGSEMLFIGIVKGF